MSNGRDRFRIDIGGRLMILVLVAAVISVVYGPIERSLMSSAALAEAGRVYREQEQCSAEHPPGPE